MVKRKTAHSENLSPRGNPAATGDKLVVGFETTSSGASGSRDAAAIDPMKIDTIAAGFANAVNTAVSSHRAEGRPVYSIGSDNKIKKS